jgi:hypothetical protein
MADAHAIIQCLTAMDASRQSPPGRQTHCGLMVFTVANPQNAAVKIVSQSISPKAACVDMESLS